MTPKSRKKISKYIWLLLAVSLAGLLISIIYQLKYNKEVKADQQTTRMVNVEVENDIVKVATIAIRGEQHLELKIKEELKSQVAQVYTMDNEENKGIRLGRVASGGTYDFLVEEIPKGILIYDEDGEQIITKLMLE